MIVLGIDPGTTSAGYAVLKEENNLIQLLATGIFSVKSLSAETRLVELHKHLLGLLKTWKPNALAIERLFFAKNQKTALAVAEARGVILLTTALAGLGVYEYTPLEVKKNLTGDGRADKIQVKKMLGLIMPATTQLNAKDDVYDAISLALICCHKERRSLGRL